MNRYLILSLWHLQIKWNPFRILKAEINWPILKQQKKIYYLWNKKKSKSIFTSFANRKNNICLSNLFSAIFYILCIQTVWYFRMMLPWKWVSCAYVFILSMQCLPPITFKPLFVKHIYIFQENYICNVFLKLICAIDFSSPALCTAKMNQYSLNWNSFSICACHISRKNLSKIFKPANDWWYAIACKGLLRVINYAIFSLYELSFLAIFNRKSE